jgi:protein-tyrosine phosphatase
MKARLVWRTLAARLKGRMDFSEIYPHVCVGSQPQSVEDIDRLRTEADITAVLNLQTDDDMESNHLDWKELEAHYRASKVEVVRIPVRDFDAPDLTDKLPECVRALTRLIEAGHTVYVHCTAGAGRSPTVAIAYLHRTGGLELEQAAAYVKQRRLCSPQLDAIREAKWEE